MAAGVEAEGGGVPSPWSVGLAVALVQSELQAGGPQDCRAASRTSEVHGENRR